MMTADDLTDRQLRILCGIVDWHRIGRPPRRPGQMTKRRVRALHALGLVTDPDLPIPTESGIALVDSITEEAP